jgi:acetolactate synthase-1/2/3 large subunit
MKLSDYVANKVVELGVKHVFMVTGGGAMHLNHSLGTHKDLECIFNHHEQACAIGAEAYYRVNNQLPLVNVTSAVASLLHTVCEVTTSTVGVGLIVIVT